MCGFLSIMIDSISAADSRNLRGTYQILLLLRQMCIIFFFLIYRFDGFGDAISTLTGILMPFIYGAVIAYLRQMCIFSASLIRSSRKSGCATLIRASAFSQVVRPFRFTQPYSVHR